MLRVAAHPNLTHKSLLEVAIPLIVISVQCSYVHRYICTYVHSLRAVKPVENGHCVGQPPLCIRYPPYPLKARRTKALQFTTIMWPPLCNNQLQLAHKWLTVGRVISKVNGGNSVVHWDQLRVNWRYQNYRCQAWNCSASACVERVYLI